MHRGVWTRDGLTLTGWWEYHWSSARFHIILDHIDPVLERQLSFSVAADSPEWGNWKLKREQ